MSEPRAQTAPRLARIALLAASLLLTAALAEGVFRLAGYTPLHAIYSKPSLFWQHDDELGWSHQPGAEGRYVGPRPYPIEFEAPIPPGTALEMTQAAADSLAARVRAHPGQYYWLHRRWVKSFDPPAAGVEAG